MAPSGTGQIKGLTLKGRFHFVLSEYGEDSLRSVLEELDPEVRSALSGTIMATSWYPFSLQLELDDAVVKVLLGASDEAAYRTLGAANAAFQFEQGNRSYASSPHLVAQSIAHLYHRYHRPGRMEYSRIDERRAELRNTGGICVPRACWVNCGYIGEAIAQVGVSDVSVITTGCGASPAACVYHARWRQD